MSEPVVPGKDPWPIEERELRRREIHFTRWGLLVQLAAVVFTLVGAGVSAYAAIQARDAARATVAGVEAVQQQVNEERYSTALSYISGDQPDQRVLGFALWSRHVQILVSKADTVEERRDAYNAYLEALNSFASRLRNPRQPATEAGKPAALGSGRPRISAETIAAARVVQILMRLKPGIQELHRSIGAEARPPVIDLANVQLYGQDWAGIDFAWLGGRYFPGIDLRGGDLTGSKWGASFLERAHLQCANLGDASLQGTSLVGADLRGANLEGADFTGARLDGVKLDGATISERTKGLPKSMQPKPGVSRADDGIDDCLNHKPYWNTPAATRGG